MKEQTKKIIKTYEELKELRITKQCLRFKFENLFIILITIYLIYFDLYRLVLSIVLYFLIKFVRKVSYKATKQELENIKKELNNM